MNHPHKDLEAVILREHDLINAIFAEMDKVIVGQRALVERILLGLISGGHVLIEGVPGLAKTLAVRTFSSVIQAQFQRVQFTPDMLPADLTGAPVYMAQTGTFVVRKGPIFTNILLADEINRAPAKVQSALLEVMEERQVTIAETTYPLDEPFMVLATQNPIEQDGTYALPESQLDRFMLKVNITYPQREEERRILREMAVTQKTTEVARIIHPDHIVKIRGMVDDIHLSGNMEDYLLNIVEATRNPEPFRIPDITGLVEYGASPRATLNLALAAKAQAFLAGRAYVTPADIQAVAGDVLNHRLIRSYRADAQGLTNAEIVQKILDYLDVP